MSKPIFLAMMSSFLLLMAISAQGQPNSGQLYMDGQYANAPYFSGQHFSIEPNQDQYSGQNTYETNSGLQAGTAYSTNAPSGAPTPFTPSSPDSLGLQIPTESSVASYAQAPTAEETRQTLIPASATSAGQLAKVSQNTRYNYPSESNMMAVSQGVKATNKLYVAYVPETVAGCKLYGWQPMWLQTSRSGSIWFYEWYPNGRLSVNYLGYSSAGWQKKWFNGDTPGWHILQYYSQGWSNYIYIYVYGGGSGYWTEQGPYTGTATSRGTSDVTLRSSWFRGYDVYLDGKYTGTEGSRTDILDGVYNFKVPGGMRHTIVISKNGQSYDETGTFVSGTSYRFTI